MMTTKMGNVLPQLKVTCEISGPISKALWERRGSSTHPVAHGLRGAPSWDHRRPSERRCAIAAGRRRSESGRRGECGTVVPLLFVCFSARAELAGWLYLRSWRVLGAGAHARLKISESCEHDELSRRKSSDPHMVRALRAHRETPRSTIHGPKSNSNNSLCLLVIPGYKLKSTL